MKEIDIDILIEKAIKTVIDKNKHHIEEGQNPLLFEAIICKFCLWSVLSYLQSHDPKVFRNVLPIQLKEHIECI